MSNRMKVKTAKVYPEDATELVAKLGNLKGVPLSRRERRALRRNVPAILVRRG